MTKLCNFLVSASALLLGSLTISMSALANPANVLDSLVVTGENFAISSADGASFSQEFQNNEANLTDCEAKSDGTICIDSGTYIVDLSSWDPSAPATALTECTDIGFEAPKGRQTTGNCSAVTVADDALYVAGIRNKNGSAIFKCTAGACNLLVQDRPPILDMDRVPSGLLYLENKDSVILLTGIEGPGAPVVEVLATGRDLGLAKGKVKEELQNVARIVDANGTETYAVTTSFGRLIFFTSAAGSFSQVVETILTGPAAAGCPAVEQAVYDVTQDADRGGSVYASVSNTCYVHTLDDDPASGFNLGSSVVMTDGTRTYNGHTVHVYEGQNVNFADCEPSCGVGTATILSSFIPLPNTNANGTVWEIKGIPHCAWNPEACADVLGYTSNNPKVELCAAGVLRLVGPLLDDSVDCEDAIPELLVFNVTPVLPPSLVAEFPGGLPELLIPPDYQAQEIGSYGADGIDNDGDLAVDEADGSESYFFDALLFKADGAQSGAVPELEVDTGLIAPGSLECPEDNAVSPLNSSVAVRIQEQFPSALTCGSGSCALDKHQGAMVTYDCFNPSRLKGCCSVYPINLQAALHQAAQTAEGKWYVDPLDYDSAAVDDSAAGKLLDKLFDELKVAQALACNDVDNDPNELAPLDSSTCSKLTDIYDNAASKLISALLNTAEQTGTNDNCSQQSRNYQSFESQIANFQAVVESYEGNFPACNDGDDNDGDGTADTNGAVVGGTELPPDTQCVGDIARDPAGRVQSLIAKTSVLPYVLNRMLLPSIPSSCPDGWNDGNLDWITSSPSFSLPSP
ncbi:MAG: hypothetical protein ACO22K_00935 [Woeseiaceae bacterium]